MEVFTVSLFGHRRLEAPGDIERELEKQIRSLLREKEYVEFLVGRSGAFDLLAASCIRRCRRSMGEVHSALVLVLPYMTGSSREALRRFLRVWG